MMKTALAALAVVASTAASAAPCLTKAEAHKQWPGESIYWHTRQHCWTNQRTWSDHNNQVEAVPRTPDDEKPSIMRAFPQQPKTTYMPDLISAPINQPNEVVFSNHTMIDWPTMTDDGHKFLPWQQQISGQFTLPKEGVELTHTIRTVPVTTD